MIDEEVFNQLLELDEDGGTEFLESVVEEWYEQVKDTFAEMDKTLKKDDLDAFSKLAHFLKGSSGQLGVRTLQNTCAKLQHYGELWDDELADERIKNLSEEEAMKRIKITLAEARTQYAEAEKWMAGYLAGSDDTSDAEPAEEEIKKPTEKQSPKPNTEPPKSKDSPTKVKP
ncbi:histidine-phosphotransfer domain, HPT domain-containing protein [Serendipita vermifera]|nr:histidine-phosphotransfer domain, HPT domain-containing protein [Serendipita vermifera]